MVKQALDQFVSKYIDLMGQSKTSLSIEFDSDWDSPCIARSSETSNDQISDEALVDWQPIKQNSEQVERFYNAHQKHQAEDEHQTPSQNSMSNIAQALSLDIHPDIDAFFTHYFSLDLPATAEKGDLALLQVWNQADYQRLQANIVAHVMMKRRLKQPETIFFAVTDDDDFIISLENDTGKVVLEQVGMLPSEVLAEDLATFINKLTPRATCLTL